MWPVATDVEWSMCLFVRTVSYAELAGLVKMPFEMWTQVGLSM